MEKEDEKRKGKEKVKKRKNPNPTLFKRKKIQLDHISLSRNL